MIVFYWYGLVGCFNYITVESCFINYIYQMDFFQTAISNQLYQSYTHLWEWNIHPSNRIVHHVLHQDGSKENHDLFSFAWSPDHPHGNPRKLVPSSQLHLDNLVQWIYWFFSANCSHTYMLNRVDPMIVPEIGPSRQSLPSPTSQSSSLDPTVWSLTLVRWNFDLFRVKLWRWVGQLNHMWLFTWFYMIFTRKNGAFNGIKRPCARNNGLT